MNALADGGVGDYLNQHFVSSFQKVGSFRIVGGQKQGGNVASYFCTPDGHVLDAVAGPVDAATLLAEARWVVETRKMGLLASGSDMNKYKRFFRLAHAERLPGGLGGVNWNRLPLYTPSEAALASFLDNPRYGLGWNQQQRVHLLLAVYPLAPLDQAYRVVYEKIVGEKISSQPVEGFLSQSAPPQH